MIEIKYKQLPTIIELSKYDYEYNLLIIISIITLIILIKTIQYYYQSL
jgi:hypothetical protein